MESKPLARSSPGREGELGADLTWDSQSVLIDPAPPVKANGHALVVEIIPPGGMTDAAVERFATCVREFGLALSRETSRLEEAERADSLERPEITATMVVKANEEVRNPTLAKPVPISPLVVTAQLAALSAGIFAGVFGSYLNSIWQWSAMIGCAIVAVTAQAYAIVALRRMR